MILQSADTELTIQTFQEKDIGADYLRWLNDKSAMRFSNQRFLTHTRSSCEQYLKGFRNTSNQFLAIHDRHENLVGTMTVFPEHARDRRPRNHDRTRTLWERESVHARG